ncbi:MAG: GDSL-type esterase/lipase family protein, partial [Propionibacteriaceae bacterium]|nr:GDSL-type esterase/lipase family protein [Propionibacteriaceae bacterium]
MRFTEERRRIAASLLAIAILLTTFSLGQASARAEGSSATQSNLVFGFGWAPSDPNRVFDGTQHRGYGPGAAGMSAVASLSKGTIQVNFTPTNTSGIQTIAHLFSSADPADGAVLSLEGSSLRWRMTSGGTTLVDETIDAKVVPGEAHQIHIVVDRGYLWIHLDASPVHFGASDAFLSSVQELDSVHVGGRAVDGTTWTDFFTGNIVRLAVTDGRMTPAEMQGIDAAASSINRYPVALPDLAALSGLLQDDRAEPATWVFTGDSITHGALHTYGYRSWAEQVEARLAEMGNGHDLVVNTAISGDTAGAGNNTIGINDTFESRVGRYAPDVVVTMIGMNDAATSTGQTLAMFRSNLTDIITKTRAENAIPIFATSNPIKGGASGARADYPLYVQAMREVAAQHRVVVVDNYGDWEYTNSGEAPALWYGDSIHPSANGHWQFTRNFFQNFGRWDSASGLGAENDLPASGFKAGSSPTLNTPVQQTYGYQFPGIFTGDRSEDRSSDLTGLPIHRQVEGTYLARFSTTTRARGVLFAMHDSSRTDSYLKVVSVDGGVQVDVVNRGEEILNLSTPDMGLDDGETHSVALAAGGGGTRLFVDGLTVAVVPEQVFGADVPDADSFHVGGMPDGDGGVIDGFIGSVPRIWVWALPAEPFNFLVERREMPLAPEFVNAFLGFSSALNTSAPLVVLGEEPQLAAPAGGWRAWPQILTERNRWERGHRQDYVVTATPGMESLPARIAWLETEPALAQSRLVLMPLVDSDITAAGGITAFQQQLGLAITSVRELGGTPVLMTSPTLELTSPEGNDAMRAAAAVRGAFVIDLAAEMRITNSQTAPSTWFEDGQLSAQAHQKMAYKVLTDLGIWDGKSNSANSSVRAATTLSLAAPSAVNSPAGGVAQFDATLTMGNAPGDSPAFSAHVLGRTATVAALEANGIAGTLNGSSASVAIPGIAVGNTAIASITIDIPADAAPGDVITVVVNASAANQRARVSPRVVSITVGAEATPSPAPTVTVTPTISVTPTVTITPTV